MDNSTGQSPQRAAAPMEEEEEEEEWIIRKQRKIKLFNVNELWIGTHSITAAYVALQNTK